METRLTDINSTVMDCCFKHESPDEQFSALVDTLLWNNKDVSEHLSWMDGPTEEPNACQRTLAAISLIDTEVPNGGLLQFFWNCPGWVDEVPAALQNLGLTMMADVYDRSIARCVADFGTYSEFRKRGTLKAYSECASQFRFDEFDSVYFVQQERIYTIALTFVSEHMADFVVCGGHCEQSPA